MQLLNDQVQICHNEVWGYVCFLHMYRWTDEDAMVVCRELGMNHEGIYTISIFLRLLYTCLTGVEVSYGYNYITNFPLFLSDPNCFGFEDHLIDCPSSEIENVTFCFRTIAVQCRGIYIMWGYYYCCSSSLNCTEKCYIYALGWLGDFITFKIILVNNNILHQTF